MEEEVTTRYVFMMMLAIADKYGDVIGTDIAIARTMNVTLSEFVNSVKPLLDPDIDSNSQAEDGRRLVASQNGRGYHIVNYKAYRDMKSDDEKREYMRNYMRNRRASKEKLDSVKTSKPCKLLLNDATHTEAEAEAEADSLFTKVKKRREAKPHFIPPSIYELRVFAKECNMPESDGESMFYHWEANGWRNGSNPVKSWQAGFRKWKASGWLPSQKSPAAAKAETPKKIDPWAPKPKNEDDY